MKKLLKTMAAVVLAASIVPASMYAEETQKRVATEAEIENYGTVLGIAETAGVLTGALPALASGMVAFNKIYNAIAPISTYLATGIAAPGAVVAGIATMMVFDLPLLYLVKQCEKTYDEESAKKIQGNGQTKTENWAMNAMIGVPLAFTAAVASLMITGKIASLA
jgi:hypothetical protein